MIGRMPLVLLSSASLALLSACTDTASKAKPQRGPTTGPDFTQAETVRITAPSHGASVSSPFTLRVEGGEQVASVVVTASGSSVAQTILNDEGGAEMVLDLPPDEWSLSVAGLDASGGALTDHTVTVRVVVDRVPAEPWVMVTSPRDGSTVTNPVAFAFEASSDVDTVEVLADDWSLGTVAPGDVLRYEFSGTGFARNIEAIAFSDGAEVARTDLVITVEDAVSPGDSSVNAIIMDHLSTYPTDGSYDYWWPSDAYGWGGNPSDIYYEGDLFAPGDAYNRSYCVGMTFEVFMRTFDTLDAAYDLDGSINGVSFDELYDFRTDWYVRDLYGTGIVEAMENYGIGSRVTDWDDVQAGDIIQFWRHSGSGHNAIFIDWEVDGAGEVVGFTYWSTQGSTDGVGYNDEYFGSSGSRVDPNFFFVGRVAPPEAWTPWW